MQNNIYTGVFSKQDFKLKIIGESLIIGVLTGFLISLFRYMVDKSGIVLNYVYSYLSQHYFYVPIWIAFLVFVGLVIGLIVKKEPMVSGGGIPEVIGVILGKLDMQYWRVILGKFIGSVLAIGSGLSMGIEGPSLQLGAAVGQGVGKGLKRVKSEQKYLVTSGASAGIAAAFNAPLAGTMFAMEQIHKNLSPVVLISALSAALSSDFVAGEFFGLKPVFDFRKISIIPLDYYFYVVILGIIVGFPGVGFSKMLIKTQRWYESQKWLKKEFRTVFCLIISIPIGLFFPKILGEGNGLIMSLTKENVAVKMLLILLIGKFIFSIICGASGTPGGIFMPLFTIGALIGGIYGTVLCVLFNLNTAFIGSFVILAMSGYFSSVIRTPITGSILVLEMTGSFNNLLPVTIMSIIAYITADLLRSKPIYEELLEKLLDKLSGKEYYNKNTYKNTVEVPVCIGSQIEGKKIKDVKWPENCFVIGIRRGHREIIPNGNIVIYSGDYLTIVWEGTADDFNLDRRLVKMGNGVF